MLQNDQPVAFASKALTETQMRYAQIEKEMLAIVFGCVKFHQNIFGKTITEQTDHKPLESIMNKYSFHKKLGLRLTTNDS